MPVAHGDRDATVADDYVADGADAGGVRAAIRIVRGVERAQVNWTAGLGLWAVTLPIESELPAGVSTTRFVTPVCRVRRNCIGRDLVCTSMSPGP